MEIVKDDLEAQMAAFEWVKSHIGSFEFGPVVLEGRKEIPNEGISIDINDGRFVMAHKGKLKWGNDGDWILRKRTGEFIFCPPNLFKGNYRESGSRV